ncbi:FMN-binding protein [Nocardioides psychrotolerans]|uniref:FMN-binding protein n=1 Tax=Nocardioides psychrotolerans TaxID=1005945 RepID=UPI0031382F75
MRRITLWVLSTITTLVLLFGYHTSTSGALTAASGTGQAVISASVGTGSTSSRTVTGDAVDTRYGPVQVQVTVDAGALTEVSVLQYPSGNHEDEQINGYALPILVDETISAQSAQIDMVSGATYTSEGYLQSLQSALDQAVL